MGREYIVYADESESDGKKFGNFYGGCVISAEHYQTANQHLQNLKKELGLGRELKWQRMSSQYLEKYKAFTEAYLSLVRDGRLKIRIMFTQNRWQPQALTSYHRDNAFGILYYQFLKNAFGFEFAGDGKEPLRLRFFLDELPCNRAKASALKGYLCSLQNAPKFRDARIVVQQDQIAEAASHEHVLMQGLDIVLGAMQFKLNEHNLRKDPTTGRRGARTIAKEKLYDFILSKIRALGPEYQRFNVGMSTSRGLSPSERWSRPYRHWLFVSEGSTLRARVAGQGDV